MTAIALTGGIAAGKTAVARRLLQQGVAVVDTDQLAAQLSGTGGRAVTRIAEVFGARFITPEGALDRALMRAHVFADPDEKRRLESILHPMIREEVDGLLRQYAGKRCVVAIPLYFEGLAYRNRFSSVVCVDCSVPTQMKRLIADRGMSPDLASAIIASQAPRQIRLQLADRVLSNEVDKDALGLQVDKLVREWP